MKYINRCLTALVALALLPAGGRLRTGRTMIRNRWRRFCSTLRRTPITARSARTRALSPPIRTVMCSRPIKPNTPLSDPHVADIHKVSDTASDNDGHLHSGFGAPPRSSGMRRPRHNGVWRAAPMEQVLPAVGFVDERHDAGRYRLNGAILRFHRHDVARDAGHLHRHDRQWLEWRRMVRADSHHRPEGRHRTGHSGHDQKDHNDDFTLIELYKKNDKLRDIVTNALVNNSACSAIANAIGAQQKLAPYPEQDGIPKLTDACSPTFAAFTELDVIGKENTHPDSDGWFDFTVNATGGDAWPSPGTCSKTIGTAGPRPSTGSTACPKAPNRTPVAC